MLEDIKRAYSLIHLHLSQRRFNLLIFILISFGLFEFLQIIGIFLVLKISLGEDLPQLVSSMISYFGFPLEFLFFFTISIAILATLLSTSTLIISSRVCTNLANDITSSIFHKLLNAKYNIGKIARKDEFQQAILIEGDRLAIGGIYPWFQTLIRLSSSFFLLLSLMYVDLIVTFISLLVILIAYFFYSKIVRSKIENYNVAKTLSGSERLSLTSSVIAGKRDIYSFNLGNDISKNFYKHSDIYFYGMGTLQIIGQLPRILLEGLIVVGISIMILINFSLNFEQQTATLGVFAVAFLKVLPNVQGIFVNYATFKGNSNCFKYFEKLNDHLDKESKFYNSQNFIFKENITSIKLENITVSTSSEVDIVRDFSQTFNMNRSYLISGSSGSGKSTIVDVILGLMPIQSGNLYLNSKNFQRTLPNAEGNIAVVSQKVYIFPDSLAYNVTLERDESKIDLEWLNKVLETCGVTNYLNSYSDGLNTKISETESNLSGGQIQRIALARALYSNSDVLILDEATNGLDYELEKEILTSINSIYKGILIYISHNSLYESLVDEVIKLEVSERK